LKLFNSNFYLLRFSFLCLRQDNLKDAILVRSLDIFHVYSLRQCDVPPEFAVRVLATVVIVLLDFFL
jgi:hypothetical protein